MPTHRELPLDRGSGRRWNAPTKFAFGLLAVSAAAAAIVSLAHHREHGHLPLGAPHHTLPNAYIAVPGRWHWRWVPVKNPPPGSPHRVRERYRTIRYVPAP
jgi:hypothetical protein